MVSKVTYRLGMAVLLLVIMLAPVSTVEAISCTSGCGKTCKVGSAGTGGSCQCDMTECSCTWTEACAQEAGPGCTMTITEKKKCTAIETQS